MGGARGDNRTLVLAPMMSSLLIFASGLIAISAGHSVGCTCSGTGRLSKRRPNDDTHDRMTATTATQATDLAVVHITVSNTTQCDPGLLTRLAKHFLGLPHDQNKVGFSWGLSGANPSPAYRRRWRRWRRDTHVQP